MRRPPAGGAQTSLPVNSSLALRIASFILLTALSVSLFAVPYLTVQ
jgi:hypothetical protein